jgi:hypothetical protein
MDNCREQRKNNMIALGQSVRVIISIFCCMLLSLGLPVGAEQASGRPGKPDEKIFSRPSWGDLRIDACLRWGEDCGAPTAKAFCNRSDYAEMISFKSARVGPDEITRIFMTDTVCEGELCSAITEVICAKPYLKSQIFINPGANGYRIDQCREWEQNCGKPAADAFCVNNGFAYSKHVYPDFKPGKTTTRVIGSGEICDQPFCAGFYKIICE